MKIIQDALKELKNLNEESLLEMANVTGRFVKIENIDFSFYFSKRNASHGIRIKINWNRESMTGEAEGYMELHGSYKYFQASNVKYKPNRQQIKNVQKFAKKYKVLFAAVWECKLDADMLTEYFKGRVSWGDLMNSFEHVTKDQQQTINRCEDLTELEKQVRAHDIYNMNV